ncbi:putative uncharacterized protein C1orf229 isoform X2 [Aquila chrysaetos chrysaetos]|uniref:putative uncharacterized protein C1orf229 isoform X2 n=1 Tax=Aquila chrysaetos chrysaetos TaxID=223781 RepID=UPI0011772CEA|nr:putative uncharacterized protein C1orf229 isoform X2 [Aquila chrysaetos chrysaetos]
MRLRCLPACLPSSSSSSSSSSRPLLPALAVPAAGSGRPAGPLPSVSPPPPPRGYASRPGQGGGLRQEQGAVIPPYTPLTSPPPQPSRPRVRRGEGVRGRSAAEDEEDEDAEDAAGRSGAGVPGESLAVLLAAGLAGGRPAAASLRRDLCL